MDEKLGSAFIEVRLDNKKLNADLAKLKGRIGKLEGSYGSAGKGAKKLGKQSTKLKGSISKLGESYGSAGKGAKKLGEQSKTSFRQAMKESVSLERSVKRLAFLFTVGLAYAAVRGIKSFVSNSVGGFISLEKQVAKVATMIPGATKDMKNKVKKNLKDMAFSFGQTTKAVSESYYNILSASFEVSEAMDVMRASALAATAGSTDLGTATKVVTGLLNSYGYEASRAYDISDLLFAMVKRGIFTFADLAQNLGKVAPIAAQMGVSLEELGAGITTATRQGVKLRETTTALNRFITAFAKPTKEAADVAKKFGINLNAAYLQSYGLAEISRKLVDATEKELVVFGQTKRSLRYLASSVNDTEGQFRDLEEMINRAGSALEAAEQKMATTSFRTNKVKEGFKNFGKSLGENIILGLNDVLSFWGIDMGEFSKSGKQMEETLQKIKTTRYEAEKLREIFNKNVGGTKDFLINFEPEIKESQLVNQLNDIYGIIDDINDYEISIDPFGALESSAELLKIYDELEKYDIDSELSVNSIGMVDKDDVIGDLTKKVDILNAKLRGNENAVNIANDINKKYKQTLSEVSEITKQKISEEEKNQKIFRIYKDLRKELDKYKLQGTKIYEDIQKRQRAIANEIGTNIDFKQSLKMVNEEAEKVENHYKNMIRNSNDQEKIKQSEINTLEDQIKLYKDFRDSIGLTKAQQEKVGAIMSDLNQKLNSKNEKTEEEITINEKLKNILDELDTKYNAMKMGVNDLNDLRDIEKDKIEAKIKALNDELDATDKNGKAYDKIKAAIAALESSMRSLNGVETPDDFNTWLKNLKENTQQSADYFDKLYNSVRGTDFSGSTKDIEEYYAALKQAFGNEAAEKMLQAYGVQYQTIEQLKDVWGNAMIYWTDVSNAAYSAISDGFSRITDDLFDGVNMEKKKWKEYFEYIASEFAKMLSRMVIELAAKKALLAFLNVLSQGSGGAGNVFMNGLQNTNLGNLNNGNFNSTPDVGGASNFSAGGGFSDRNIVSRLTSLENSIRDLNMNPSINVQPTMRFSRRDLAFISKEGSKLDNATRL